MMKKIALIYMGGTFGCIGEPLSPMPANAFLPKLQHVLPLHLNIECFVAPVIRDSSACTAPDWLALIQQIQSLQLQQFQHFVIIHGTDTLSYASAVLAHFIGQSAHIVLTDSQYPLFNVTGDNTREFTDAIDNLNFALESVHQLSVGVYLAFHHQLMHAQSALKVHTTDLKAFDGLPATQPLSTLTSPYIVQANDLDKAAHFNCLNWMWQPIATKLHSQNLAALLSHTPDVLILQGFGTGNIAVDAELLNVLKAIQQKNCKIILSTQVVHGGIDQRYAVSDWVKDSGILLSNCLGHADLYAKCLKMYLQYGSAADWTAHWND